MAHVTHIVGARPNFMKAAPVVDALAAQGVDQRLVHTGQHYDEKLSDVFFVQLGLPDPDANLGVGSGSHATQTAALLTVLEQELTARPPAVVVVYGDVNSTLAAALVCAKLGLGLAHVEAGLRSFDRSMPEEVNRVVTDALSDLHLTTSPEAADHLAAEGVAREGVVFVGNPMIDTLDRHRAHFDATAVRTTLDLPTRYGVVTLHRPGNVDDDEVIAEAVAALAAVATRIPLVFPVHPRGRARLADAGLESVEGLHAIEPLDYLAFMGLVRDAAVVITDSGGIQEETTVLGVPCVTVRPNTERPITITHGTNRLTTVQGLPAAVDAALAGPAGGARRPPLWDGQAGERIAAALAAFVERRGGARDAN